MSSIGIGIIPYNKIAWNALECIALNDNALTIVRLASIFHVIMECRLFDLRGGGGEPVGCGGSRVARLLAG